MARVTMKEVLATYSRAELYDLVLDLNRCLEDNYRILERCRPWDEDTIRKAKRKIAEQEKMKKIAEDCQIRLINQEEK